jgi:2-polyprenyl-6-methoxyphenol hydroxylase-like FAD-dependent oxidoreductase
MNRVGERAVIIGAGMAGLAAAGALVGRFDDVIVLERDRLPASPEWRLGAPQGQHVHALLTAGQRALERLLPGFTDALVAAGAVPARANADSRIEAPGYDPFPQRDFGWLTYCASRPLIEFTARGLAEAHRVVFRERRRVRRLEPSADAATVAAVWHEGDDGQSERLAADLVVDASGRAAPTLDLLQALGRAPPEETVIGVDFAYSSAVFETPVGAPDDWKILLVMPGPNGPVHAGLLAPIEGGRWIVSLGGRGDDTPPDDVAGYMAYAQGLRTPTLGACIGGAKRLSDPVKLGFRQSIRRHFEKLDPLPRGLIPIGDSLCRFNPIYGQGMSVAALEAVRLAELLDERAGGHDPLADLSEAFVRDADAIVEGPWRMSALPDLASPETRGERPADLEQMLRFGAALQILAAEDPEVHKLDAEVRQLIKPPSALLTPEIIQKVASVMAREASPEPV